MRTVCVCVCYLWRIEGAPFCVPSVAASLALSLLRRPRPEINFLQKGAINFSGEGLDIASICCCAAAQTFLNFFMPPALRVRLSAFPTDRPTRRDFCIREVLANEKSLLLQQPKKSEREREKCILARAEKVMIWKTWQLFQNSRVSPRRKLLNFAPIPVPPSEGRKEGRRGEEAPRIT